MEGLIDKNRFHEQKIVNTNNCDKTLEGTLGAPHLKRSTAETVLKS
jgi:hypothetical protein